MLEAALGALEERQALDAFGGVVGSPMKSARPGACAAPHPAAQLVELRQAEALGVLRRSASVAFGTSTPTSITVVATSTRDARRPRSRAIACVARSRVDAARGRARPVTPGSALRSRSKPSRGVRFRSAFSDSSTSGYTT